MPPIPKMRLRLLLLLIVALLAAPLAPVRAKWSCPDGTPCVAAGKQGFECTGGQCRVQSCCETPHARRCRHGALPGMAGPGPSGGQWQGPDHCRFQQAEPPQLTAIHDTSKLLLADVTDFALLPAEFRLPHRVVSQIRWLENAYGYRPPPLRPTGPARAPPLS